MWRGDYGGGLWGGGGGGGRGRGGGGGDVGGWGGGGRWERRAVRRGRSEERWRRISVYSWGVWAIRSGRPRFSSRERPARPTTVGPMRVGTATPMKKESRLVVWPL